MHRLVRTLLFILIFSFLLLIGALNSYAQDVGSQQPPLITAPDNPQEWKNFRTSLYHWRKEAKQSTYYNDSLYNTPAFQWVHTAYNCCLLMMYDKTFYDQQKHVYKVDEFIQRGITEFGGYDIVVLWHAYPRIGLDDRNQFDFYRDMPGGLNRIKEVVDQFHQKGIKVFINYNPWDTGTKRENGSDIDALVQLMQAIDADGVFLDTMDAGNLEFREKLNRIKDGIIMESELALPITDLSNHHASWAQWFGDSPVPGILRNKWFERRHMQHSIARWNRSHNEELQTAWMNGSGTMIWKNVFGQWVGWNAYDKFLLKSMVAIQRKFSNLFAGEGWIPLVDENPVKGIYANLWYDENIQLWTLVNRSAETIEGGLLHVEANEQLRYFDLIRGIEVDVHNQMLPGKITPRGIGCFAGIPSSYVNEEWMLFLQTQAEAYGKLDTSTVFPAQKAIAKEKIVTTRYKQVPVGMLLFPATKTTLKISYRVRECGLYQSSESYFIDKKYPQLHQLAETEKKVQFSAFAIDKEAITNKQYRAFLQASNYAPSDTTNFLKHWTKGKIVTGEEDNPVVYVDINDARAYALWAGKRLASEYEWQWAAQSGSMDFGKVWELTESEYEDEHNCFCMLKGGSPYQAKGSEWYFDGGVQSPAFVAKQLLIYPGIDRCSTVGFRCAVDRDQK